MRTKTITELIQPIRERLSVMEDYLPLDIVTIDVDNFYVHAPTDIANLIAALELAYGELKYISTTNHGYDCDHHSDALARDTMTKIKRILGGGE